MVEIAVMYTDLSIERQPIEDIHLLPKDGVLFILIRDTEKEGKTANITFSSGLDNYALCQRYQESADWVMLFGWDDGDYKWFRIPQCEGCQNQEEVDAPIGYMHTIFRGGAVDAKTWAKAEAKFNAEVA